MNPTQLFRMNSFTSGNEHLQAELQRLDILLQLEVNRLRETGQFVDDPFRGLHISERLVDAILSSPVAVESTRPAALEMLERQISQRLVDWLPLEQLRRRFGLSGAEIDCLIAAAAVDLDERYERLYAYAQNDVTRKRPTVGLLMKLAGGRKWPELPLLEVFHETAPLFALRLLRFVEDAQDRDPAVPARALRVEPRILEFLLGRNRLDARLANWVTQAPLHSGSDQQMLSEDLWSQLRQAIDGELPVCLVGTSGSGRLAAIQSLNKESGRGTLVADLARLPADLSVEMAFGLLLRDAALLDCGVCVICPESMNEGTVGGTPLRASTAELFRRYGVPLVLLSPVPPSASALSMNVVRFPPLTIRGRQRLWERAMGEAGLADYRGLSAALAGQFRLSPEQIAAAVGLAARGLSANAHLDEALVRRALSTAARTQAAGTLGKLARRVESPHDWSDLVVLADTQQQLRDIATAVRCRARVMGDWGFERRLAYGRGVVSLFTGPSGTGKTMAASIIARELQMDLYAIDLSSVVSKYIGETEKNLSRIFDDAHNSSAVLFFDEADALFGKRSGVQDARDRYANIEVAYLLQKLEQHDGVVILASNLAGNLDEAFARRIQHRVEFCMPRAFERERIWRGCFPSTAPLHGDIDFGFLSRHFELAGGNISSIVISAACDAAERDEPIAMRHLIPRVARELRKLGHLPSGHEFREYAGMM
jgi:hypothetical protein